MQFDGLSMRACITRLNTSLAGARVQRVVQVSPCSVSLELWAGKAHYLLCSAEAEAACLFLAPEPPLRQETPGQFVSLLRRHLIGARLAAAEQNGWDRVAGIAFRGRTELGDETTLQLWVETMGKHSNLILARADGRILDAAKRVGRSRSRVRQVLPGLVYTAPPASPPKLDPDSVDAAALAEALGMGAAGAVIGDRTEQVKTKVTAAALVRAVAGVGPERAKELLRASGLARAGAASPPDAGSLASLTMAFRTLAAAANAGDESLATEARPKFWEALDGRSDPAGQPGPQADGTAAASVRPAQRALQASVLRAAARAADELSATAAKVADLTDPAQARREGDAIMSSLADLRVRLAEAAARGEAAVALSLSLYGTPDDEPETVSPTVTVQLVTADDPVLQAQARYAQYAAANRRRDALAEHMRRTRERHEALAVLSFQLEQPLTDEELQEVAAEAEGLGVAAANGTGRQRPVAGRRAGPGGERTRRDGKSGGRAGRDGKPAASQPRRATSPGGYEVLIGRNNHQNDAIIRLARDEDLWFHARGVTGAHVLLRRAGRAEAVSAADIEFAAALAAEHSRARQAGIVAVDYVAARLLRRERGAAPGFVTYSNETTVHVRPATTTTGGAPARA